MRRATSGTLLTLVVAVACAAPPRMAADRAHDPEADRLAADVRRLEDERGELARSEARQAIQRARLATDGPSRRAELARAWSLASSVLRHQDIHDLAGIAPDVLRVYHLGDVLDAGGDERLGLSLLPDRDGIARDAGGRLLQRVAAAIRLDLDADAPPPEHTFVVAVGECLVSLQPSERTAQVERSLDRLATVGGGHVHAELGVFAAEHTQTPEALLEGLGLDGATPFAGMDESPINVGWRARLEWYDADETTIELLRRAVASASGTESLAVDAPFGRLRSAVRSVNSRFLQDFDVDARSAAADPLIGESRAGTGISAHYGAGDDAASVAVRVHFGEMVLPIPEFSTSLDGRQPPVKIQIPEMRIIEMRTEIPVGQSAFGVGRSLSRGAFVVTVDAPQTGAPSRPAWRRVRARTGRVDAAIEPLVENALELASSHLAAGRERDAADALRLGVGSSRLPTWTHRVRLGPRGVAGVLVRRRLPVAADVVAEALRRAEVETADEFGFLHVGDRTLVAAITPASFGPLERALGALERDTMAAPVVVVAPERLAGDRELPVDGTDGAPRPGLAVRCKTGRPVSYVADFDLELARDAVIADPIIQQMHDGAIVDVRAVPGEAVGTFDVLIDHHAVRYPIPIFQTPLGALSEVSIQLPVVDRYRTTLRVWLGPGETRRVTSTVSRDADQDSRGFVVTRRGDQSAASDR